jgi:hypothetical protein
VDTARLAGSRRQEVLMWSEEVDNGEAEPSLGSFDRMIDQ